jgi:hypothetical protein
VREAWPGRLPAPDAWQMGSLLCCRGFPLRFAPGCFAKLETVRQHKARVDIVTGTPFQTLYTGSPERCSPITQGAVGPSRMTNGMRKKNRKDHLALALGRLAWGQEDRLMIAAMITALDDKYKLSVKLGREPGLDLIIQQLVGRIVRAFGPLSNVQGKRILDLACGSNTSKAPSSFHINTPFRKQRIRVPNTEEYSPQFEPWFCRILLALGADPVGIDLGDLNGEEFEHYRVDLGQRGALDFMPAHSFDAIQDSRLFGSPEFTSQFPKEADRLRVAHEIRQQEQRLLRPDGIVIHSDAEGLTQKN